MRNRFKAIQVILNITGSLLIVLGGFLLLPLVIGFLYGEVETINSFLLPSLISFFLGFLCRSLFRSENPNTTQAMLICSLGWLVCSAIGALPFVIGINTSYLNGFFEAMSGFTTTGITMFTGLDYMPKSILFWRSLTQWIGGLGILTFFLAVTYRGGSAHRLFGAETHKIGMDRPVPGLANTLKILWAIYAGFTLIIIVGLLLAGVSIFDSVCHSFTALSTGGFSPHDASIGYYRLSGYVHYRWIEYILIVGMIMGGTNFLIHYRVARGNIKSLFDNTEMKYWWTLIIVFVIIILIERFVKLEALKPHLFSTSGFFIHIEENFRTVLFQVTAIITTTGFATKDIGSPFFGFVAKQLFLVMMVIGGCIGSTGGGVKVFRVSILFKIIQRELYRLRMPPRAITTPLIDGKPIETDEIYRVSGLFFTWIVLLVIGGCVTAFLSDLGSYESFSGMFSALGNIGPCYIPVRIMGQLNPVIKIVYIFGMLAGRLEILPVLLIFSPKAWRS
ncbi:cation transporter [candidate division TA06 bacterium DG_78]|uniref:Cation transporter n=1 Tax=candidate division TA06 bacterium DG_78 TaxID=1703772 RepID=A0A0S7YHW3_UNCT6|nr:MAG: cation transporter [candidate division TA06 bacterium DG_78]